MTLHIVKLCVGVGSIEDLADRQKQRLSKGDPLFHRTRMSPRRRDELVGGGSIYWVIKGQICVRQRLADIRETKADDGLSYCEFVLDKDLINVRPTPRRAFQGWRYLNADDAPPDLTHSADSLFNVPPQMRADLIDLCLI